MRFTTAKAVSTRARAWRRVPPLLAVLQTRLGFAVLLALLAAVALAQPFLPSAAASAGGEWRYEPALPPPPPPGVAPAPDMVPLGTVGEISFWAPNRGLLITGGGGIVKPGLYAYDGVSWHQLADVCGGAKGRIAWAGPDEFWTVADQRAGQVTSTGVGEGALESLSLCHFIGDEVVASYAMPLGQTESYVEMDAAACLSAADCWFAGQDGTPPHEGSFHLHWNGSEVTALYDASDHSVASLAPFAGKLYEGLAIGPEDSFQPGEEPKHPPVIRTVAPAGQTQLCDGAQAVFCNAVLFSAGQSLPEYPQRVLPYALGGLQLASDGTPFGTGATQLWAAADPVQNTPQGSEPAKVTILRDAGGSWMQILPSASGASPLPEGALLGGSREDLGPNEQGEPGFESLAPEPGGEDAWLSLQGEGNDAGVVRLGADGVLGEVQRLPGPRDLVGPRGSAGPIACPAAGDCWMATSEGWLFHLSEGAAAQPDTDPLFDGQDGVISARPPDSGVPQIYPDGFGEDDSLVNQQLQPAPIQPSERTATKPAKPRRGMPLVSDMKSHFLHGRTLVVSFKLSARAHVQLIARRSGRVVAETRRESLRPGRHTLSLSFQPARWPNKLQFQAKPVSGGAPGAAGGSQSESESGDTVAT